MKAVANKLIFDFQIRKGPVILIMSRGAKLLRIASLVIVSLFAMWLINPKGTLYMMCGYTIYFICYVAYTICTQVYQSVNARNPKAIEALLEDVRRAKIFLKKKNVIE